MYDCDNPLTKVDLSMKCEIVTVYIILNAIEICLTRLADVI